MNPELLEETKAILKSLIISCPHGMSVNELNKNYCEREGVNIPFKELGFADLHSFLNSLKGTITMNGSKVLAVTSEKTKHIVGMITRQRRSRKRRRKRKSPVELNFGNSAGNMIKEDGYNELQSNQTFTPKQNKRFLIGNIAKRKRASNEFSFYPDLELEKMHLEMEKKEIDLEYQYVEMKKKVWEFKYQILDSKLKEKV